MAEPRTGTETVQDEPRESSSARNEGSAQETKGWRNVKRTQDFPITTIRTMYAK